MKKVIYTCVTNGYDVLKQPSVVDDSFDYICFTDKKTEERIGVWQIRLLDCDIDNKMQLSRYVKLMPHKVLGEYDYSLWIDGNINIIGYKLYELVNEHIRNECLIAQVSHPERDCIYEEIKLCENAGIFGFGIKEALRQVHYLSKQGFPHHFGLCENNIILRKHNNPLVIKISEEWWSEFNHFPYRDQMSLMFVYWKNDFYPTVLLRHGENTRNVDYLSCINHKKKKTNSVNAIYESSSRWSHLKAVAFYLLKRNMSKVFFYPLYKIAELVK